jgi:hypothetical protein
MIEIKYHKDVLQYLDGLVDVLIEKGYLSFYESAAQYVEDLVNYVSNNIAVCRHRTAPSYFCTYGEGMLYITYKRSQRTTWYIFFQKTGEHYFIRYITNNHVAAQYF